MQVERFIRAMYFPPFDGAAMLVNGRQMPVESVEVWLLAAGRLSKIYLRVAVIDR